MSPAARPPAADGASPGGSLGKVPPGEADHVLTVRHLARRIVVDHRGVRRE
jgi:hypothetical protein